ncbi:DUF452 family protein [Culturomica massiliensis]|uniref:DUF452 family protein n=1 Tax=Culturomica massiliensis TaxID=1841857 RepID=UPI002665E9C4|nr:pimeloyl-ACP methyl esterase BioG family protein [Culturomica massiliensis]
MRIEWIKQYTGGRVVVFYNGWGMDNKAVSQLRTDCDLLICSDYRSLELPFLPDFSDYREIYLVAWSMGVWAAANTVGKLNISPRCNIAINGTEYPVDDNLGIPCRIYALTERGMNIQGRDKFFCRMLDGAEDAGRFVSNRPCRDLPEQVEELRLIRTQSAVYKNNLKWDKIFVSEKDVIFPVMQQMNWASGKAEIKKLRGGHYPFYNFQSWEDIINF